MVKKIFACLICGLCFIEYAAKAVAVTYTYTSLTVAGAGDTILNGINNAGTVVGAYGANLDITQPTQPGSVAFAQSGQTVTSLSVPFNSLGAEADSINNNGVIAGTYVFDGGGGILFTHGFVKNGSTYTDVAYPGGLDTAISDIDDAGVIVGFYSVDFIQGLLETVKGFRGTPNGSGGYTFSTVDFSGGDPFTHTFVSGRNNAGQEVATYAYTDLLGSGDDDVHGVLLPQQKTMRMPGAPSPVTIPTSINNSGVIVGQATIAGIDERLHEIGFITNASEVLSLPENQVSYVDLNLPGTACTFGKTQLGVEPNCHKSVLHINDNGLIVGFNDNGDGVFQGFIGTPVAGVLGDYNGNSKVDAPDYVLWRKGGPLQNEGDSPGTVNQADYTYWRSHFGAASGIGTTWIGGEVPEPTAAVLAFVAFFSAFAIRGRNRRERNLSF